MQGQRVTEWVADAIGLPQYIPVFKDNLITVSMLPQGPAGRSAMISICPQSRNFPSVLPASDDFVTMQVLDFPLLVKDGGASLKSDLGVCSKCYHTVAQSSVVQSWVTMQDMALNL